MRGFQAADDQRRGDLLREVLDAEPNHVYGGLLAVLLRLVFLLYAEERGLMPRSEVFAKHYALMGLFERLKGDRDHHPDTIDQLYGAWAQLLSLFRLVFDGGGHGDLRLPARHGHLFNPDRYPFLEGRAYQSKRVMNERLDPPHVSDGVVLRVLERLVILDGERLSYRTLDVEQIGSVYETIMGFDLCRASGRSIAVKAKKRHGAPAILDLEALLDLPAAKRAKGLKETTDQDLTGKALAALKAATTPEDVVASLGNKVAKTTPIIVPAGAMVLVPSDERRRSGSHYTPRALTEPIVRTALAPILEALGPRPRAAAILALDVCDPAMGSGAFLVEACRQLGDALVLAWRTHGETPQLPPDEDVALHARRVVAQRCLYGVDKNPLAVDLAKLSLWLATLARDHPFTFLDHALKAGDSLVGLGREQIRAFTWGASGQATQAGQLVVARIDEARSLRERIQSAGDAAGYDELRLLAKQSDDALDDARLAGDLVISAFFAEKKANDRDRLRATISLEVDNWLAQSHARAALEERVETLHKSGVRPFHWEIEFPEVFAGKGGFDAMVGNPPFAGKNTIADGHPAAYPDWLKALHSGSHGNSDLVAHFYRRAFTVIRPGGTFGLIATKTIRQGDTRSTGLRFICLNGGAIYNAVRRLKWPGEAAVVVSIVHILKGTPVRRLLDGREVDDITAYLFHRGGSDDPATLRANANKSFQGSIVLGMGFTFDDTAKKGVASPIAEMERLIAKDPRNAERIFPYIGGEEVNTSPTHAHHRYVINFGEMSEEESRRWPDLMALVEERVKPERLKLGDNADAKHRKENWWLWGRYTPSLFEAIRESERVLAISRIGNAFAFAFLATGRVFSEKIVIFPVQQYAWLSELQSRVHEAWARFFSTTLKDDLQYTPSRCFETSPFPPGFESDPALEAVGRNTTSTARRQRLSCQAWKSPRRRAARAEGTRCAARGRRPSASLSQEHEPCRFADWGSGLPPSGRGFG